ncbi:Protein of unknown function, partial [Gryllus bimaculatus]
PTRAEAGDVTLVRDDNRLDASAAVAAQGTTLRLVLQHRCSENWCAGTQPLCKSTSGFAGKDCSETLDLGRLNRLFSMKAIKKY